MTSATATVLTSEACQAWANAEWEPYGKWGRCAVADPDGEGFLVAYVYRDGTVDLSDAEWRADMDEARRLAVEIVAEACQS